MMTVSPPSPSLYMLVWDDLVISRLCLNSYDVREFQMNMAHAIEAFSWIFVCFLLYAVDYLHLLCEAFVTCHSVALSVAAVSCVSCL